MDYKVRELIDNARTLKDNFGWRMLLAVRNTIAAMYVLKDKKVYVDEIKELTALIKSKTKWYSPFRSYYSYFISSYLILNYEDPKAKYNELLKLYEELKNYGLPSTFYNVLSALILLDQDMTNLFRQVTMIKATYQLIRKNHPFLTSYPFYPLAAFITLETKFSDDLVREAESLYQQLGQSGLVKGVYLQALAYELVLVDVTDRSELVMKIVDVVNGLKNTGVKVSHWQYPLIGFLALFDLRYDDYQTIRHQMDSLNTVPGFRSYKQFNLLLSALLLMSEKTRINQTHSDTVNKLLPYILILLAVERTSSSKATP